MPLNEEQMKVVAGEIAQQDWTSRLLAPKEKWLEDEEPEDLGGYRDPAEDPRFA